MKLIVFLGKLFSSSNEASMRRFIAFFLLTPYTIAIFVGLKLAYKETDYQFFLTSLIAAGLPILLAYFLLTWEHVLNIIKEADIKKFIKKEDIPEEVVPPEQINNDFIQVQ